MIKIPIGVKFIGVEAFGWVVDITSIKVMDGNPHYDSRGNCNAIIETETNKLILGCQKTFIPDGVKSIGSYAFSNCTGLKTISFPNSVITIENNAFSGTGLSTIDLNQIEEIGNSSFSGCKELQSLFIPKSVRHIEKKAFAFCDKMDNIEVDKDNYIYDSRNKCNAIIETATNTLIYGISNTIPDNVVSIGEYAYCGCSHFETITIPNSVTSIGDYAFDGCSVITINLPINLRKIGYAAFQNCHLNSIILPKGLTSIGDWAFNLCRNITSIEIPNSITTIGEYH